MKFTRAVVAAALALASATIVAAQSTAPAPMIRDIAAGTGALVVKADGSVLFWGRDPDGQAARPPSPNRVIGAPIVLELPEKAMQVACGETTQYALLESGKVVAWGTNDQGQLGNGPMGASGELGRYPKPSVTPVQVTGLDKIIQIEAGWKHAVALREDGTVWAWGTRDNGEIGDGPPKGLRPVHAIGPTRVPGLTGVKQIAVGFKYSMALTHDGHVWAWGSNSEGELGNGTREPGWSPTEVKGLDRVVAIAAGSGSVGKGVSAAVRDDGTLWMWGTNTSAQIGNVLGPLSPDDPGARVLLPVPVKGVVGVKSVSIGFGHVAALLGDGTLRMWGHDGYGQIGVGTSGFYHLKPVRVTGLTKVAAVYLGGWHSFAVREDGTLWMWGDRYPDGQGLLGRILKVPTLLDLR